MEPFEKARQFRLALVPRVTREDAAEGFRRWTADPTITKYTVQNIETGKSLSRLGAYIAFLSKTYGADPRTFDSGPSTAIVYKPKPLPSKRVTREHRVPYGLVALPLFTADRRNSDGEPIYEGTTGTASVRLSFVDPDPDHYLAFRASGNELDPIAPHYALCLVHEQNDAPIGALCLCSIADDMVFRVVVDTPSGIALARLNYPGFERLKDDDSYILGIITSIHLTNSAGMTEILYNDGLPIYHHPHLT